MITTLGDVILKSGEKMVIKIIEPPQEDYVEKLCHFLEHKETMIFRWIKQRLDGKYVDYCVDKFFIGEINNHIVGEVWYGLPKNRTGIGNFGETYTEPLHRRKGVASELVKALVDDFHKGDGKCLLCGAGRDPGRIYEKYGFRFMQNTVKPEGMALLNKGVGDNFRAFDEWYFEGGFDVKVREGNIADRHDCDRMLYFSKGIEEINNSWHRAFIANQAPGFLDALFCVEDGKGIVTVMENSKGHIMGYSFFLNLGLDFENDLKVMDFTIHPNYFNKAVLFVNESCKIANRAGIEDIYAFSPACDEEKNNMLADAGFREEYRFAHKFKFRDREYDLICFKK